MANYALVVGINDYTIQSQHDANQYGITWPTLSYCVNDADGMYHLLTNAFGFEIDNITLLKDNQATRRNILSTLNYLIGNAEVGDVICFYYAGHGGLLPATTASDNTKFYESIIPYQGDWIYDFQLHQIIENSGFQEDEINFTIILDCCHSGGMHSSDSIEQRTPRTVPFRPDVAANIAAMQTMWPFGICLPDGSNELIPNDSNVQVLNEQLIDLDEDPNKTLVASSKSTLISACKYYELADEDATFRHGLLTQGFLNIVNSSNFQISHSQLIERLVSEVRGLSSNRQTPQLRGKHGRAEHQFLTPFNNSIS